jgi:hypothetical protein
MTSTGGKYHNHPWSKYFLVAAFFTPQALLASALGSPVRSHSLSSHSFMWMSCGEPGYLGSRGVRV